MCIFPFFLLCSLYFFPGSSLCIQPTDFHSAALGAVMNLMRHDYLSLSIYVTSNFGGRNNGKGQKNKKLPAASCKPIQQACPSQPAQGPCKQTIQYEPSTEFK